MKMSIYSGRPVRLAKSGIFLLSLFTFCATTLRAQSLFLSTFPDPTSRYSVTQPGCVAVFPPDVSNAPNVSSATLQDYASLSGTVATASAVCTGAYRVSATLNLAGLSEVPASTSTPYNAGFKVRLSNALLANLLGGNSDNIHLVTLLNGVVAESANANAIGISLLQSNTPGNISFSATKPFNEVAVDLGAGVLALGVLSGADYFYSFAGTGTVPVVLPVKLTSFSASATAKNIAITWATTLEANASRYQLERSSDGGTIYSIITTVAAKGNAASETSYSYTDGTALGGNYVYRLKIIDKDGKAEYSRLATVKMTTGSNWKIYPTLLSSGTDLNVVTASQNGSKTQVLLTNLQGQAVRTASTNADAKAVVATGGLSAGVYVLKLYKDGQLQASEKIVIQ